MPKLKFQPSYNNNNNNNNKSLELNEVLQDEHWGVEVQIHAFLTSPVDGGQWGDSSCGHFAPGFFERRLGGSQCQCGVCGEEKILSPALGIEPDSQFSRRWSLYRLSYCGSKHNHNVQVYYSLDALRKRSHVVCS